MRYLVLCLTLIVAACAGRPNETDPSLGGPDLILEEYFDGHVIAHGQFQDVFGTVRRRFSVDIKGDWDGETLTLVEDFIYADKTTEQRIWRMNKTPDGNWTGNADGVIGQATGKLRGDTLNWAYKIDLPVPEGTLRVDFDDWMWLLDEKRLLNRAYMSRFGVYIGDVVIFFEKQ